jgi:hypothetical protein
VALGANLRRGPIAASKGHSAHGSGGGDSRGRFDIDTLEFSIEDGGQWRRHRTRRRERPTTRTSSGSGVAVRCVRVLSSDALGVAVSGVVAGLKIRS